MDTSKKNLLMVSAIIACLGIAGAVTFVTTSNGGGIPERFAKEKTWVKCDNCGATYQISKKEYFQFAEEHTSGQGIVPPMPCKECGEKAVYQAIKCDNCGHIFFPDAAQKGFSDTCPECGYSKTEERLQR